MIILKRQLQRPAGPITVHLIGAGGTGSMMLTHLARINSTLHAIDGRSLMVTLTDPDIVTEANMGRQMFSEGDLNRYKAQVLIERVNRFYGLQWAVKPELFNADAFMYNIVISCTDTKKSRLMMHKLFKASPNNTYQHKENFFWIDCGNGSRNGNVIIASKQYEWPTVCEHPDWNDEEDVNTPSCSIADAIEKQDLFTNSWIANIAGTWLWQILHKRQIDWRGAYMDVEAMRIRKIPVTYKTEAREPSKV